jgi:hypothetical protein
MEKADGRSVAAKLKNNKKAKQGHCLSIGSRAIQLLSALWVLAAR